MINSARENKVHSIRKLYKQIHEQYPQETEIVMDLVHNAAYDGKLECELDYMMMPKDAVHDILELLRLIGYTVDRNDITEIATIKWV